MFILGIRVFGVRYAVYVFVTIQDFVELGRVPTHPGKLGILELTPENPGKSWNFVLNSGGVNSSVRPCSTVS